MVLSTGSLSPKQCLGTETHCRKANRWREMIFGPKLAKRLGYSAQKLKLPHLLLGIMTCFSYLGLQRLLHWKKLRKFSTLGMYGYPRSLPGEGDRPNCRLLCSSYQAFLMTQKGGCMLKPQCRYTNLWVLMILHPGGLTCTELQPVRMTTTRSMWQRYCLHEY